MPLQRRLQQVGIAKQASKGNAAATATYGFGLRSGNVVSVDLEQDPEAITAVSRHPIGATREGVRSGAAFTTRVWPRSIGLLLYAALGGLADAGAGNYTHTITPAADIPNLTLFGQIGALFTKMRDCKVDELSIKWDEAKKIEVETKIMGGLMTPLAAAYTIDNDEVEQTMFAAAGGTFKLDTGSAVAVAAAVVGGEIKIENKLEGVALSKSFEVDEWYPGEQLVTCTLRLKPADLAEWRKIITGTDSGVAIQTETQYGSFDEKFVIDANTSIQIAAARVAFKCDLPDADPGGGPAEITAVGIVTRPAGGGAEVTATVKNQVATY